MDRWEGGEEKLGSALSLTSGCCDYITQVGEQAVEVAFTGVLGVAQAVWWRNAGGGRGRTQAEVEPSVMATGK